MIPMKLEFTLRQHTPMIHFQHDQAGATLRATEVKPKLDRYLIDRLGGWESIPSDWRVGGQKANHEALDYKIHFSSVIQFKFHKHIIDQHNPKELVVFSSLDGKLLCYHAALANEIKQNLPGFFAAHNFGNRTSKGYGSFTVELIDGAPPSTGDPKSNFELLLRNRFGIFYSKEPDLIKRYLQRVLYAKLRNRSSEYQAFANGPLKEFLISKDFLVIQNEVGEQFTNALESLRNEISTFAFQKLVSAEEIAATIGTAFAEFGRKGKQHLLEEILDQIAEDHRDLKSGRNHQGYYKSLLMEYFCEKGVGWEKRRIKQELQRNVPNVFNALMKKTGRMRTLDCPSGTPGDGDYIRGLLGLADHFEFKTIHDYDSVKIGINQIRSSDRDRDVVQRFQAPTLFKVFGHTIYLIPLQVPSQLACKLDGTPRLFNFDLRAHISGNEVTQDLFQATIPVEFSLTEFLDYDLQHSSRKADNDRKRVHELLGYTKH